MTNIVIEEYNKREGNQFVNMLHDKNFLNPELSRESTQWLEEYISWLFQSNAEMTKKSTLLIASFKK